MVAEPKPATSRRAARPRPPGESMSVAERIERNRKAAALIREWMDEDSDYDERVGAALEAMGECPVRLREDFD